MELAKEEREKKVNKQRLEVDKEQKAIEEKKRSAPVPPKKGRQSRSGLYKDAVMNERDKKLKRELDRRIDVYDTPEEEAPPKSKKTAAPKAKSRLNPKLVKDAAQREKDRNL